MENTKRCTKCGETKPTSAFSKHRSRPDGLNVWCKNCVNKKGRAYRKTPAGIYTILRGRTNFYKTKPFNLDRDDFITWYNLQEKKCVYCDIKLEDLPKLSDPFNDFSHRLTVDCKDNELGYVLENIVLACRRCNSVKSDILTFEEMMYVGQNFIKYKWQRVLEGNTK